MKSIRTRMLIIFGVSISFLLLLMGFLIVFRVNTVMLGQTEVMSREIVLARANEVGKLVNGYLGEIRSYSKDRIFLSGDVNAIKQHLAAIFKDTDENFELLLFADLKGGYYGSDNSSNNIADRDYFKAIVMENKKSFVGKPVISKSTGKKIFVVAYEVTDTQGQKVGLVAATIKLDTLSAISGSIKVDNLGYGWIVDGTGTVIAHPDEKITMSLNVLKSSEIGFKGLDQAGQKMISGQSGVELITRPDNVKEILVFSTIPNTPQWSLGVAVPEQELYKNVSQMVFTLLLLLGILLVGTLVIVYINATLIAKPLVLAAQQLDVIANADFRKEVPPGFLKRKDEIGGIARSIHLMQESIKAVVRGVLDESGSIGESTRSAAQNMFELSSQIEDVSATTEEMSAGMEQTAASTQEMNATSVEIERAIESIAQKAQEGARAAGEISKRAQALKENSVISQKSAHEIRVNVNQDLRTSIEQAKAVEQINTLTESILQITSQINLLALNAAIEAARAGEAGKGFAVVADEIRKLAEDSKKAVTDIQNVTKLVVSSVQNLTHSSQKVLEFIETTVIQDYQALLQTGEQYFQDAEYVENLVTEFSATSEEVTASIQNMIKAINEITVSNNEAAEGTQNIAVKTSDVASKASSIVKTTEAVKESTARLLNMIAKFKV